MFFEASKANAHERRFSREQQWDEGGGAVELEHVKFENSVE